jgi:hypothetical protein
MSEAPCAEVAYHLICFFRREKLKGYGTDARIDLHELSTLRTREKITMLCTIIATARKAWNVYHKSWCTLARCVENSSEVSEPPSSTKLSATGMLRYVLLSEFIARVEEDVKELTTSTSSSTSYWHVNTLCGEMWVHLHATSTRSSNSR